MMSFRAFFIHHSRLALLLVAMAVAMKAMVPDGFMPNVGGMTISIRICADATGQAMTRQIVIGHKDGIPGKSGGPCAFSALGHGALGGADAVLLACALLFLIILGFAPVAAVAPRRIIHLRPPLRGPPQTA